jgi:hypothetical protein
LKTSQHPSSNFLNSKHPLCAQILKISKHPNSQFLKNSKNQNTHNFEGILTPKLTNYNFWISNLFAIFFLFFPLNHAKIEIMQQNYF